MKNFFAIIIAFFAMNVAIAQSPINKGQAQLNVGVGLSSWGVPVYLGLDYGISQDFTLGGELSYRGYNDNWAGTKYKHSIMGVSGNLNYHFNRVLEIPRNWDLYLGLNGGFYVWNSDDNYPGSSTSRAGLGAQVGGRYYFSEKVGVNLEFGGGNAFSGGKFGLSFRL